MTMMWGWGGDDWEERNITHAQQHIQGHTTNKSPKGSRVSRLACFLLCCFWQRSTPAFTLRLLVNTVRSDSRQSLSVSPAGSEGAMSWGPLVWKAGLRQNRRPRGRVPKHGLLGALVDLRRLIGRNVVTWGMLATTVDGIRVASLYSLCSAGPNRFSIDA